MGKHSAKGTDNIPASILKDFSWVGITYMTRVFNNILSGSEPCPSSWKEGIVKLFPKKDSPKGQVATYRPITITSVTYRLFAKVLAKKLQTWVEANGILGEMQNGF